LDGLKFFFLQHAEHLGLGLGGQPPDLIEEEGAAVGLGGQAAAGALGARSGAQGMTQQPAFEHGLRSRSTMQRDEGLVPSR